MKLKTYKISWKKVTYGESFVNATSKKEARKLAKQGKDENFESYEETYGEIIPYNITSIERVDD